jgi:pyrimidine operon attenuation protein/uracil phosphoribosyltransferase
MTLKLSYQLMTAGEVRGTLEHLAEQIVSANAGRHVVLLGIQRRGIPMAQRMAKHIGDRTGQPPQMGMLDINLYRDDLTKVATQPVVRRTEIPSDIDDKDVILVDDVLYTGRTIGSALRALIDFGRMRQSSSPCLWIEDTVNCRSKQTSSERRSTRKIMKSLKSGWPR